MKFDEPWTPDQVLQNRFFSVIARIESDAKQYDRSRRSNRARFWAFVVCAEISAGVVASEVTQGVSTYVPAALLAASISSVLAAAAHFKAKVADTANGEMLEVVKYGRKSNDLGLMAEDRGKKFHWRPVVASKDIARNRSSSVDNRAISSSSKILLAASSAVAALLLAGAFLTGVQALFGGAALALVGAGYYARKSVLSRRKSEAYEKDAKKIYNEAARGWESLGWGEDSIGAHGNWLSNTPWEHETRPVYKKIENGEPLGPISGFVIDHKIYADSDKSHLPEAGAIILSGPSDSVMLQDAGPWRLDRPRFASPILKGADYRPADKNLMHAGASILKDAGALRLKYPGADAFRIDNCDSRRPAGNNQRPGGRKGRGGSV